MTSEDLDAGVYSLVLAVDGAPTVEVGALGSVAFPRTAYVYVGSARGPGGFARIERHRELARGERDVRGWHVDHVLGHGASEVAAVARSDAEECAVAALHRDPPQDEAVVAGDPVTGFGASDCDCDGHLYGFGAVGEAFATARRAHAETADRMEAAWCNSYQERGPPSE